MSQDTPTVVVTDDQKLVQSISDISTELKSLTVKVKELSVLANKLAKEHAKLLKKKSKKAGGGARGGFQKPALLSDDLCSFIGVDKGAKLARTEVTRKITAYIKENELYNKEDKRQILPDDKLKSLINCDADTKITYFNLQSLIKHHFTKDDSPAPDATASAA